MRALRYPAAVVAVAAAAWLIFGRPALNSDVYDALIWGRDIAHGLRPRYEEGATPHPLPNFITALLSVLGRDGALHAMEALSVVFLGWLLVAIFELGRRLADAWTGALAAVLFCVTLAWAAVGYFDTLALALLVTALIAFNDRRPMLTGGLLFAAGLIRPDYWLICAAFAAWQLRKRNLLPGLIAAAAPVVWMLCDLAVTGHPLFGLTHTQDLAAELHRDRGLGNVPHAYLSGLRDLVKGAVVVAAVPGVVIALRRGRAAWAMLTVAAAGLFAYLAIGVAGLSLISRYLAPTAAMLAVFAAFAATQVFRQRDARAAAVSVFAAAVILLSVPARADNVASQRDRNSERTAVNDSLRHLANDACGPIHVAARVGIVASAAAYGADTTPGRLRPVAVREPGTYIAPASPQALSAFLAAPPPPAVPVHDRGLWATACARR